VVDIWRVAGAKTRDLLGTKNIERAEAENAIDDYLKSVQRILASKAHGCDLIALKGTFFGNELTDITDLVIQEASGQNDVVE
jgi:hypothetical protein